MNHILLIHSSVDGRLGCFPLLAIVKQWFLIWGMIESELHFRDPEGEKSLVARVKLTKLQTMSLLHPQSQAQCLARLNYLLNE